MEPLEQYSLENWKENAEERKKMGAETLLRNVEISVIVQVGLCTLLQRP